MAQSTLITLIGNLGSDPELRFTPQGMAVCNLSVAVTPRVRDANGEWVDGDPAWYQVTVWREQAENAAESFEKGQRVIVYGDLVQRNWEDREGNQRTSIQVNALELGHAVRFGTSKFTRGNVQTQDQQQSRRSSRSRR